MKRDIILDAWRGIAIIFVLIHHLVYFHYAFFRTYLVSHASGILWQFDRVLVAFAERSGPIGVEFFFVVSGYIITRLMLEEEAAKGSVQLGAFYIRRAFRILPPLYFYVLCVAIFAMVGWVPLTLSDTLTALSFACNTGLECGWHVVHTWTLAVEMQFYLLWPVIFLLLPARWRGRFLFGLVSLFIILSALELFLARGWIDNAGSFACIALGAFYAVSPRFRHFAEGPALYVWGIAVAGEVGLWALHITFAAHAFYRALIPLTIALAVFTSYRFGALARSWMVACLAYVGLISYSLYLWQEVFAGDANNYLSHSPLQFAPLMLALALLSYFLIERPFIAWGKKLSRRLPAPAIRTEGEALGI